MNSENKIVLWGDFINPFDDLRYDIGNLDKLTLIKIFNYSANSKNDNMSDINDFNEIKNKAITPQKRYLFDYYGDGDQYEWGIREDSDETKTFCTELSKKLKGEYDFGYSLSGSHLLYCDGQTFSNAPKNTTGIACPQKNFISDIKTNIIRCFRPLKVYIKSSSVGEDIEDLFGVKYVKIKCMVDYYSLEYETDYIDINDFGQDGYRYFFASEYITDTDVSLDCDLYFYDKDKNIKLLDNFLSDIICSVENTESEEKINNISGGIIYNGEGIFYDIEVPKIWAPECEILIDFQWTLNYNNTYTFNVTYDKTFKQNFGEAYFDASNLENVPSYLGNSNAYYIYGPTGDYFSVGRFSNNSITIDSEVLEKGKGAIYVPMYYNDVDGGGGVLYFQILDCNNIDFSETTQNVSIDFNKPIVVGIGITYKGYGDNHLSLRNELGCNINYGNDHIITLQMWASPVNFDWVDWEDITVNIGWDTHISGAEISNTNTKFYITNGWDGNIPTGISSEIWHDTINY